MSLAKLNVAKVGSVRARTFFEQICPELFQLRAPLCRDLGGRYAFHLDGPGGGTWTLDFASAKVVAARRSGGPPADLEVRMTARDFEALLSGELDAALAIAGGTMRVTGDRALFDHLAVFTAPPRRLPS